MSKKFYQIIKNEKWIIKNKKLKELEKKLIEEKEMGNEKLKNKN